MPNRFGELLTKHRQRIRASMNKVGYAINLAGATILNWENGTFMPRKNHRDEVVAGAQFLRLTEQETNEFLEAADFDKEYVLSEDLAGAIFVEFIRELFTNLLHRNPPVMLLLTQANWGEPPFREALLTQARKIFSPNEVLHIQPPYSSAADANDYFSDLGRQCGFSGVTNEHRFEQTFQECLENSERLFLLVSRFEQGVRLVATRTRFRQSATFYS